MIAVALRLLRPSVEVLNASVLGCGGGEPLQDRGVGEHGVKRKQVIVRDLRDLQFVV
jgi:hypothetical protein